MKVLLTWLKYIPLTLIVMLNCYSEASLANMSKNEFPSINKKFSELETIDGRIGVYAINTANNQSIEYRSTERLPLQSTSKVMVVSAILKKSMAHHQLLEQRVTYAKPDLVVWSPITEKHITDGMTISELCAATMKYSDNTAMNLLMKELGGPQAVTNFSREIHDNTFRLDNWEPNLNSDMTDLHDTSTPKAMAKSLQKITLEEILPSLQQEQLLSWMKGNTTGDARIRAGVPKGWIVADKTGSDNEYGIANDIGIIWPPHCAPIVVAIYVTHNKTDSVGRDKILAAATRIVIYEFAKTDSCLKRTILL